MTRWDATNGYAISLQGAEVTAFTVLDSAGTLNPGDVVAALRAKTSIVVLGKIVAPG